MAVTFRWSEISDDPNHPAVVRRRQELLDRARRAPVERRLDLLRSICADKVVLDVGVVEHFAENRHRDRWLHKNLVDVAASCRGVDILAEDVEELRAQGYDVVVHDLTHSPLDDRFDVVVVGEVIEHLGAPEPFLANIRPMLADGGRLVVTTPNPYMLNRTWQSLRGRFPDSVDHALLLGPGNVLELATRAGLALDAWRGVRLKDLPGWRNRMASAARRGLVAARFAPELACDTLVYELVAAP